MRVEELCMGEITYPLNKPLFCYLLMIDTRKDEDTHMAKLVNAFDGSEREAEKITYKFCNVGSSPTMSAIKQNT